MNAERFETTGPAGKLIGRLAGRALGGKRPVVLVHGINMSSDVWSEVMERLGTSRRVVAFDLRGNGASGRQGPFRAGDYADDTLAVLDHLAIERAHVVGTSFGGSVACALAAKARQRVASIVAIGSALAVEGLDLDGAVGALETAGVRPFFAAFLPQASFAPGTDPNIVSRALDAAADGRDVDTVVAVSTTALRSDLREVASEVRVPALVVTGQLDATCPVAAGEAMARALRAEHRIVPRRGHVLPLEDPETVARLVEEFVAAHEEES